MTQEQLNESTLILYEIIRKINDNSLSLASLPDFIIKVNEALTDDRKTIKDISTIIQHEVSLSARIMRIANSPALRGNSEITSISHAIQRLGLALVKNLAICVALTDRFTSTNLAHKLILDDILQQSIRISVISYMIAEHMAKGVLPESALVAGLVSKVGHLVTLRYLDDHPKYRSLNATETGKLLECVGDEVTLHLLRKWDFPIEILDFLYGIDPESTENLTRKGSFNLTHSYLRCVDDNLPMTGLCVVVDSLVREHHEELDSLRSVLPN